MRVSSGMMINNYLSQLNTQYQQQADLMQQSDGNAMHKPADNPVAFVQTMISKNSLSDNNQYTQNLNTAVSWMQSTDDQMTNISNILQSVVEKTNEAATGTNSTTDTAATGAEISSMADQIVADANTQLGGRYLFSGSADQTQPYSTATVTAKADLKTLDTNQTAAFGTSQMLVMTDSSSNTYYLNPTTGSLFSKDYVDTGYKATVANNAGATTAAIQTAVAGNSSGALTGFNASTIFVTTANGGVGTTFNTKGQLTGTNAFTSTIGGTLTNLTFSTSDKKVVVYSGDDVKISMPIQNGAANPASDSVNSTGVDLFGTDIFGGQGSSVVNDLYEISAQMKSGNTSWLSSDGITLSQNASSQVLNAQTDIGSRQQVYGLVQATMANQNTQIQTDITNTSASDTAALIVKLQTIQTLYNMSLSVGSKILPLSLADYLK